MKVSIDWLKELVAVKLNPKELCDRLTMAGVETTTDEKVLDIDVLPNRGDGHSVIGIAREVAAVTGAKLTLNKVIRRQKKESKKKAASFLKVSVIDKKLCPRYMARVIENVQIKESPLWLKERLQLVGMRPINNVVDITNYLLLELGQPMHAFDHAKLKNGVILVRRAAEGEKIVTIDNVERKLNKDMLVIADAVCPVALAGVMGGANTEVSASTKTVVLESAYFDPISISKTSKSANIRTESSIRFEKSVDWEMVATALDAAAAMIAEIAGGEILAGKFDIVGKALVLPKIELRIERLNNTLGINVPVNQAAVILKKLGFKLLKRTAKKLKVLVPSFRAADVLREIDLIEEIARIYGYHHIPETIPGVRKTVIAKDSISSFSKVKDILVGCGLFEVQTYSFVNPSDAGQNAIKVANPMVIDEAAMRTSLLPGILKVVSHNNRHQVEDVRIFEAGKIFKQKNTEEQIIAGAISYPKADFSQLTGILETLLSEYFDNWQVESVESAWYHPSKSAAFIHNGHVIARAGLLHPEKMKHYGFAKEVYVFEVSAEALLKAAGVKKYRSLAKFPKVERDIAMFVPEGTTYANIISVINEAAGDLLEEVSLFDIYKNSQAYRLSFRDLRQTLTDEVVNAKLSAVIKALEERLKVQIRK